MSEAQLPGWGASVRRATVAAVAFVLALLCACAVATQARAADARIAIGHYHWSPETVHIDLGQKVTWYWVGPDTMHSVTGYSANDLGIDSDPGNPEPMHKLGFTFTVVFNKPGVYLFHCKLHNVVHGVVIVSDTPGNPNDDPDPIPKLNVDLTRPTISNVYFRPSRIGLRGTTIHYSLDDRAAIDAEIWHVHDGHRGRYAGWQELHGHIGFNYGRFAARGPHFRPAPGRYMAMLTATDMFHNVGRTKRVYFTIHGPPQRHTGASHQRRAVGANS